MGGFGPRSGTSFPGALCGTSDCSDVTTTWFVCLQSKHERLVFLSPDKPQRPSNSVAGNVAIVSGWHRPCLGCGIALRGGFFGVRRTFSFCRKKRPVQRAPHATGGEEEQLVNPATFSNKCFLLAALALKDAGVERFDQEPPAKNRLYFLGNSTNITNLIMRLSDQRGTFCGRSRREAMASLPDLLAEHQHHGVISQPTIHRLQRCDVRTKLWCSG